MCKAVKGGSVQRTGIYVKTFGQIYALKKKKDDEMEDLKR